MAILVLYMGLLLWAPIPLGSNRPWSWALLQAWVLVLALWWLIGALRGSYKASSVALRAWPMLLCAGAWVAYIWFQLVPLPMPLLEFLSPQAASLYKAAALPVDRQFAPLTLDSYATLESACRSTAFVAFFWLSLVVLTTRERIRTVAAVLVLSGILHGAYGAFVALPAGEVASGTFVNRNHYAAYLVICLSIGVGLLIATLSGKRHATWSEFLRSLMLLIVAPRMALRLGLMVMVIALVLSHSRMGNVSLFVSLMIAGGIGLALSKRATRSMVVLLVSLMAVDVLLVGTYFGAERVVQRVAASSTETEDRDELVGYAWNMWKDYPVFGSGLGSFPVVFPRYSAEGTYGTYTHAHNDYLELAAETGVIGILLLAAMVVLSFAAAVRAQFVRRDPLMRGLSFGAMMSIIALMIHSAVEFSLQIPAIGLSFMLVLAFAWIARFHNGNGSGSSGAVAEAERGGGQI